MPVEVDWPPALFTALSGIRYAISGSTWIEVPSGTTLEDVPMYMVVKKKDSIQADPDNSWKVTGSRGSTYIVTVDSGNWKCTCPGFGWRRRCKHISEKKAA